MSRTLALLALALVLSSAAAAAQPNILVVTLDDLAYGDLPSYGGEVLLTPNLDRLAADGVRYTQFYAQQSCIASHIAFLSGRHFRDLGLEGRTLKTRPTDWHHRAPPFPLVLKHAAGYSAGAFILWHMGDISRPEEYGFDVIENLRGQSPAVPIADQPRWAVDQFLSWVETAPEPWFAWIGTRLPHSPLEPSQDQLDRCASKMASLNVPSGASAHIYCASMVAVDDQIGRLVAHAESSGARLLLYSDNGPPTWDREGEGRHQLRDIAWDCGGLRGYKGTLYECGVRTPLIEWHAGGVPGASDRLSSVVDIYPTVLEWAGVAVDTSRLTGESLSTAYPERPLFFALRDSGRRPAGKTGTSRPAYLSPPLAIRKGPWKLLCNRDLLECELYNIERDPYERDSVQNVAAIATLAAELNVWMRSWPTEPLAPLAVQGGGRRGTACKAGHCSAASCGENAGLCESSAECLPGLVCLPYPAEWTTCEGDGSIALCRRP